MVTDKDIDAVNEYRDKEILCIKGIENFFSYSKNITFKKGEFYELHNISRRTGLGVDDVEYIVVRVYSTHLTDFVPLNYTEFFEHFELVTIEEVRKRKIVSILK